MKIWKRVIKKNKRKFYILPDNSVGEDYKSKVKKISSNLKKVGADYQFITACENNAWLLNIRGQDTEYSPIPNCFILIDNNENIKLFCDLKKISQSFKKKFNKIKFIEIKFIEKILSEIINKKFIIDKNSCSLYYEDIILDKNKILNFSDPIYFLKSIKKKKEIDNIKKAHLYDGAALTKYLFWLKKNFVKKRLLK